MALVNKHTPLIPLGCLRCATQRAPCTKTRPCMRCVMDACGLACSYNWTLGNHILDLLPNTRDMTAEIITFPTHHVQPNQGSFGSVYRTTTVSGHAIAVKVFKEYREYPARVLEASVREAWIWSNLSHENIVPLLGVADLYSISPGEPNCLCMVSLWTPQGNIMDRLSRHPDSDRLLYAHDISKGLKYMHFEVQGGPVVHGDLKGNNVLMMWVNNRWTACLTDFGLSGLPDNYGNNASTATSSSGNVRWLARERLFPQEYNIAHRPAAETTMSDVWELMRCILEIFSGGWPYAGAPDEAAIWGEVVRKRNPARPNTPWIDDNMWGLMQVCWADDRQNRPDVRVIEGALRQRIEAREAASRRAQAGTRRR